MQVIFSLLHRDENLGNNYLYFNQYFNIFVFVMWSHLCWNCNSRLKALQFFIFKKSAVERKLFCCDISLKSSSFTKIFSRVCFVFHFYFNFIRPNSLILEELGSTSWSFWQLVNNDLIQYCNIVIAAWNRMEPCCGLGMVLLNLVLPQFVPKPCAPSFPCSRTERRMAGTKPEDHWLR